MELDPLLPQLKQPALFELDDTSSGSLELFPEVWSAAEALTQVDISTRRAGLNRLVALGAPRLSPLVAYLIATRVSDPDVEFRSEVVKVLGDILSSDAQGNAAPETVRQNLAAYLYRMRTREIYALLQAVEHKPEIENSVTRLLSMNPYAGNHLADILASRKALLPIRQLAIRFISLVGYLDAIPALEHLVIRLESRLNGQQTMPFLSHSSVDDTCLLPEIKAALSVLHSP